MQDFFNKIKNWFKNASGKKITYEKPSLKPESDWVLIFISIQIAIVICGAFAFYFYTQVESGSFFKVEQGNFENEVKINNQLLSKTLEDINLREQNLSRIKEDGFVPPDPSR